MLMTIKFTLTLVQLNLRPQCRYSHDAALFLQEWEADFAPSRVSGPHKLPHYSNCSNHGLFGTPSRELLNHPARFSFSQDAEEDEGSINDRVTLYLASKIVECCFGFMRLI